METKKKRKQGVVRRTQTQLTRGGKKSNFDLFDGSRSSGLSEGR